MDQIGLRLLVHDGTLLLQEFLLDVVELRPDRAKVLHDGEHLVPRGVELVLQLADGLGCLLLRLVLGVLVQLLRGLLTFLDAGDGRLVDLINGGLLQLLLLIRVDVQFDLLLLVSLASHTHQLFQVLVALLLLGAERLRELSLVRCHLRVDLALFEIDALVHGLVALLLNQLLALHQQSLHFTLLFLLDLKLALQFLLLEGLGLLLFLLFSLVLLFLLLGSLHLLHLLFGGFLGLGLSILSNFSGFDGLLELLLFLVFFIEGLLTDFFELNALLLLIKFFLQNFLFELFLQLHAHGLLISQLLGFVDHFAFLV